MDAGSCNLDDRCRDAGPAQGQPEVDVVDDSLPHNPARCERLGGWTRAALGELGVTGEVRIRIVNDPEMARLHERHTGIGGTTDVLTFDLRETDQGPLDTDLVVCVDEARRQAALRGLDVEHELLLYVVHGILHCAHHDDHDPAAAALMHQTEDRVLAALGIGAVYDRPARREGEP